MSITRFRQLCLLGAILALGALPAAASMTSNGLIIFWAVTADGKRRLVPYQHSTPRRTDA